MAIAEKTDGRSPMGKPSQSGAPRKRSSRWAREPDRHGASRFALAKGPLGIVLAGLLLIETIMGLVVRSDRPPANASFVIYAMVVLAFLTLLGFFIVWTRFPPGYLYPPSQFRDDRTWLTAVKREDILPSERLPLPSVVNVGAFPEPQSPQGLITSRGLTLSVKQVPQVIGKRQQVSSNHASAATALDRSNRTLISAMLLRYVC